jgi:hypothetical protein
MASLSMSSSVAVYGFNYGGVAASFGTGGDQNVALETSGFSGGSFSGNHGDGLDAYSNDGYGLTAGTSGGFGGGHGGSGVVGGVLGQGLIGYGKSGSRVAAVEADDTVGGSDLVAAYAYNSGTPSESFIVQSNTANASGHTSGVGKASDLQISGDVYVSGNVYQSCSTFPETSSSDCGAGTAASVRGSDGRNVRMYTTRESAPAVEDVGIAHLSNGRVHVPLDPAFARTMSHAAP